LIKAHLNNGTELKCVLQEDLVYSVHGTILITWEVVNISLPTLTYCKYDVILSWNKGKHIRVNCVIIFV
jgi:hypothetical protein